MEQMRQALESHYGLRVGDLKPIDYGMWEFSCAIHTDRGRLFAKRFMRRDRPTEGLLRGLALGERLRAQGFPAPAVVPALTGDLVAQADGERYVVTEWVEGACYHPGELPLTAAGPMGALLGRFHRLTGPAAPVAPAQPYPAPQAALERCRTLLARFADRPEPFAAVAREVLSAQIDLLGELPTGYADRLPLPSAAGTIFNSFWVEQLLFRPDGSVAALIDWTDGAGRQGHWVGDLDTGIHLTVLEPAALTAFVAGYQAENPLPEPEWRALAAALSYGHLASTNFLAGWLQAPYRRMADWEATATLWHRQVVPRFVQRQAFEEQIMQGAALR